MKITILTTEIINSNFQHCWIWILPLTAILKWTSATFARKLRNEIHIYWIIYEQNLLLNMSMEPRRMRKF